MLPHIKKLTKLELSLLILLLTTLILTRFYKLGSVPHGMTWDEAAIGYNGYAIITARHDEWLQRLPVSFQSFGDYKAPFAIYLTGIFTALFGSELWIFRLPFALSGVCAGLGMYLLTLELFSYSKSKSVDLATLLFSKVQRKGSLRIGRDDNGVKFIALCSLFFVTLSPWHHHYSRAGFESGMALTFIIWGLYFFLVAIKKKSMKFSFSKNFFVSSSLGYFFLFTFSFVLSIYTYHSSKVTVPVVILGLSILYWKDIKKHFAHIVVSALFGLGLLIPFLKDSLYGEGLTRAGSLIISRDLSIIENITIVLNQFITHFSPSFLIFGQTTTLRHGDGVWGVLLPTTLVLAVLSLFANVLVEEKHRFTKVRLLSLLLIFAGILPAAMAKDVPHSNRALLALPGFLLLATHGMVVSWHAHSYKTVLQKLKLSWDTDLVRKQKIGLLIGLHGLFFAAYLGNYYTSFAQASADDFADGYIEAFEIAKKYEKGNDEYPKADQIIFTDEYGQPYIYALYVRRTDPIWYRGGSLNTYLFTTVKESDLGRQNTLVVGGQKSNLPIEKANHLVYGSEGEVRFSIHWTGE